ncbi:MAG: hypothetical protein LBT40_06035 [Deltaproteobacteria bacterium]|jgi:hypothetical protein|nr:hypothetical protein [Deltaproteobacteria bacterium]
MPATPARSFPPAPAVLFFLAFTVFPVCLASSGLHAQSELEWTATWTRDLPTPFTKTAVRPENATDATYKDRLFSPKCPKIHHDFIVSYPRGLDAGGPADAAAAAVGQKYLSQLNEERQSLDMKADECDPDLPYSELYSDSWVTSSPYQVSPSTFSVLFSFGGYSGGAHGYYGYESVNLLSGGTLLTLGRLFPSPPTSLPRLWNAIFRGFCRGNETAPSFYGNQPCGGAAPPVPDPLKNPQASLDDAGHLLLTSRGLSVILGGYEGYGFVGAVLDIPREEVLGMGADPAIWR